MADRRRPRLLLAALALVSLVLMTLDFREGDDGPLTAVQDRAVALFAPVQELVGSAVAPLERAVETVGELGDLRERNAALEAELEELRQRSVSLADLERENERLRELLDMRDRYDFETVAARVIARPPGASRWSVLVDVGTEDGIAAGMAVIDGEGLVGTVTRATDGHARVQLAHAPEARYAVRLGEEGHDALLSGGGHRAMEVQIIEDTQAELEEGDRVLTRAFQGTSIPDGLPVGSLAEGGSTDRTPQLPVDPAVDFASLDLVQVVVDVPEAPTPEELDEEAEDDGDAAGTGDEDDDEDPEDAEDLDDVATTGHGLAGVRTDRPSPTGALPAP